MKKFPLAIIAIATISSLLFTACRKDEYETPQMTLVTNYSSVQFSLGGSGEATIDWGDGTPSETYTFAKENLSPQWFTHSYSSPPPHVIIITGDNITSLDCAYSGGTRMYVRSLDVSKNPALTELYCHNNLLTNLDLSRNPALTELYCYNNRLTNLNLSRNPALTYLDCSNNQLTNLDLSRNTALTYLDCWHNQLTNLDLSRNTALTELICYDNQLTNLDVSKNTALTYLNCSNNQLTNLDLSRNTALTYLDCSDNQLTHLDVSKNTVLTSLYCLNNQLTHLDVSNTALTSLFCFNNQLQADALNTLFHSLPVSYGAIYIYSNPGTEACDKSIATAKGWSVIY